MLEKKLAKTTERNVFLKQKRGKPKQYQNQCKRAKQVSAVLEPSGICRTAFFNPLKERKTVGLGWYSHTLAACYINVTSKKVGQAANISRSEKYSETMFWFILS